MIITNITFLIDAKEEQIDYVLEDLKEGEGIIICNNGDDLTLIMMDANRRLVETEIEQNTPVTGLTRLISEAFSRLDEDWDNDTTPDEYV